MNKVWQLLAKNKSQRTDSSLMKLCTFSQTYNGLKLECKKLLDASYFSPFSAIIMETDTVKYLIDHYLYLVPLEIKSKLKYPYLQEHEIENEKKRIAEIILKDYKDGVFLNNCPICGKLARTPKAKQCRFCGHDWH